jgi:hypothetical protein
MSATSIIPHPTDAEAGRTWWLYRLLECPRTHVENRMFLEANCDEI